MKKTAPYSKNPLKIAILTSLASSFSLAAALSLSKQCLSCCSINQVSFFKSFFSMIPVVALILRKKKDQSFFSYLRTDHMNIHLIRGLSGIATVYLFLLALRFLSLAETTLLFNTTPLFVPLVAFLWKKEPIDHKIWPGLFISFLGMIFLLQPQGHWYNMGLYFALFSGIVGAITIIAVRLSHTSEPVLRTVFYYNTFSAVFSGILWLIEKPSAAHLFHPSTALALLCLGIFGFSCQTFFTLSVKYAPAKVVAPLSYMSVIFGIALDFILWKISILPLEFFGMFLVLIGLYYVTFHLDIQKKEPLRLDSSLKNID
ncbi:MAG: DMT family transporter [Verrucomicrobia bacterium]|nr:DMT family transporter [Verrucomicrobiota bacterium]